MDVDMLKNGGPENGPTLDMTLPTPLLSGQVKVSTAVNDVFLSRPKYGNINNSSSYIDSKSDYCSLPVVANSLNADSYLDNNSDGVPGKSVDSMEDDSSDTSSETEDPVECGECSKEFSTLQEYMDHACSHSGSKPVLSEQEDSELSDGESFDGKIVYNPDGSAYIIEGGDSDLSDIDPLLDVPRQEGSIVDVRGVSIPPSKVPTFPQIANAFFVPRNPSSLYNNIYMMTSQKYVPEAPTMHSYRVYDVRSSKHKEMKNDKSRDSALNSDDQPNSTISCKPTSNAEIPTVPTKPILMCFICKLSFGFAKSFTAHAVTEHDMKLTSEEKEIMSRKNSSAIIQRNGKDKEPLMSFLEPNPPTKVSRSQSISISQADGYLPSGVFNSSVSIADTNVSCIYTKPNSLETVPVSSADCNSVDKAINGQDTSISLSKKAESNKPVFKPTEDDLSLSANSGERRHDSKDFSNNNETFLNREESARKYSAGDSESGNCFIKIQENGAMSELALPSPSGRASISPLIPSPSRNQLTLGFYGMCDEHPMGRAQDVECPKCDMVVGSTQSLGGHMTMMHTRNSCKTLKCPKCNWHYKYQETLEIHMKEKHPENDAQCIYCLANQPHPRLARGESYTCGYKPYRCEICNYSTTTKGNLSIHMQSDKHMNNVQDLANGSEIKVQPPQQQPQQLPFNDANAQMKKNKQKYVWRCDVCNYETNVARNLRIHMTSEKHTHNMMVLQQNMKHMQDSMQLQVNHLVMMGGQDAAMLGLPSALGTGPLPFPYNQNMFMRGMPGGVEVPVDLSKEQEEEEESPMVNDVRMDTCMKIFQCCICNGYSSDNLENLHQHIQYDRSKQNEQENIVVSNGTYLCNLCSYKTNLKANFQLHCKTDKHLQRLQIVNHIKEGGAANEWRLKYLNASNPIQVRCNGCDYYTNSVHKLQIHTGTQRHESSAHMFRHLQQAELKCPGDMKYYHCVLCKFSSKSKCGLIHHVYSGMHLHNENTHQMELKEQGKLHELDVGEIFVVREYAEDDNIKFDEDDGAHENTEEVNAITPDGEIKERKAEPAAIFPNSVTPNSVAPSGLVDTLDLPIHMCPYCNFSSASEMRIEAHVLSQHTQHQNALLCPLCQDEFKEKPRLEKHLVTVHNVTAEGLQRLLVMVDHGDWKAMPAQPPPPASSPSMGTLLRHVSENGEVNTEALEADAAQLAAEDAIDVGTLTDKAEFDEQYRCQTCSKTFLNIDGLYAHQNELGHLELKQTPRGPGYLCWKKGCNQYFKTAQSLQIHFREIHAKKQTVSFSDRHIYKFRCNQCSLAFKTLDKLQLHSQYHMIRAATRCQLCGRSFRSIPTLNKHVETAHELTESELEQYRSTISANELALFGATGYETFAPSVTETADSPSQSLTSDIKAETIEKDLAEESLANSVDEAEIKSEPMDCTDSAKDLIESNDDEADGLDSNYKDQQFMEDFINSQAMAEGSYEDPGRKYKCHRCKVAFTKQNYLTAHNKTLLHRKGDKLSYPMEKYLDPNRPFKCDICKESFTQKNILMVHYNSVSHLHKFKQASQQGNLPSSTVGSMATSSSGSTVSSPGSAEGDKKPFKCNVCKVAYSQAATLEIHMRSVLHHTKSSKIQEMSGQLDFTPFIEQTQSMNLEKIMSKPNSLLLQQPNLLTDMLLNQTTPATSASSGLSQTSLLFQGIPGVLSGLSTITPSPLSSPSLAPINSTMTPLSSPGFSSLVSAQASHQVNSAMPIAPKPSSVPEESALYAFSSSQDFKLPDLPSQLASSGFFSCQRCSAVFASQDALQQHQHMFCYGGSLSALRSRSGSSRNKPQIQRSLLENFGFECVMQFNEYTQPSATRLTNAADEDATSEVKSVEGNAEEKQDESADQKVDLPEINPCACKTCGKEFSSVWVLKSHEEEVHGQLVDMKNIETFGEQFKSDYDLKQPKDGDVTSHIPSAPQVLVPPSGLDSLTIGSEMPPPQSPMDIAQMLPLLQMLPLGLPHSTSLAMNMHPPLIPMIHYPGLDNSLMSPLQLDSNFSPGPKQAQQQQAAVAAAAAATAAANNQKRARTRINDEQLKILRAHFDINNSPSEEQIISMSEQSGLAQKVIKHWFRNTLFKERQRNKDSPYNFNNPPQTTLNLEEYEKTGIMPQIPTDESPDEEPKMEEDSAVEPLPIISERRDSTESQSNVSNSSLASVPSTPTSTSYSFDIERNEYICHSGGCGGKRANRTRFTDYQIKVLQDYFDKNAYPKDDDLDHLSKILNLNPRVIVVWFQNARQKARRIYENQPPVELTTSEDSKFQRTPGLNYQCKKCNTVFQRYYELIKHHKNVCFQEDGCENLPEGSAAVSSNGDEDSNSSMLSQDDNLSDVTDTSNNPDAQATPSKDGSHLYKCEKCNLTFSRFELWQEHQNVHMLNPTLFQPFPSESAFAMLQNVAAQHENKTAAKRKVEDEDLELDLDQPRDKRLRTTILPEQLDYLYQQYQIDSNPSRKQLDHISCEVGLKKRVVQVWFQNTRARERKGHYRAHQQLIHKRCPFCRALFRAKSALEAHLATKHPEEMAKSDINVDALPDETPDAGPCTPQPCMSPASSVLPTHDLNKLLAPSMQSLLPFMPPTNLHTLGFPPMADPLQLSMKQYYEDSFKKYISDLSVASHVQQSSVPSAAQEITPSKSSSKSTSSSLNKSLSSSHNSSDDAPLDLSKPIRVNTDLDKSTDGPSTDVSERSMNDHFNSKRTNLDDSFSETHSESMEYDDELNDSYPTSPSSQMAMMANKRYRTQMTSYQVNIMKNLFVEYKTPTMAECEMLGKEIGLAKRVVQVWFQNARAKEKKCKLSLNKNYGAEVEFTKQPEECALCNFKYSHKYTVQDHVFTKKHIDNIKSLLQTRSDAEKDLTSPSTVLHHQEVDRMRKAWEETATSTATPHLSQLQAMGLNAAMGLPVAVPGLGNPFSSQLFPAKKESGSKHDGDKKNKEPRETPVKKEPAVDPSCIPLSQQLMSPFGGFLPCMDNTLFPYMYPGLPGMIPNMGLPIMQPGLIPGLEHLLNYDPNTFGTPLPLLQIPQQVIKNVLGKLGDVTSSLAQYTQDCKSMADLKAAISDTNYSCARESTLDVGYICKQCQMVYPGKEACITHQRTVCFAGKMPDKTKTILKLEQVQFECHPCGEKLSTVSEFKAHCHQDMHKHKLGKHQHLKSRGSSSTSGRAESMKSSDTSNHVSVSKETNHSTQRRTSVGESSSGHVDGGPQSQI